MNAIVVYESHWGNTAAVAAAIAEGIGPDARAMTTSEATPSVVEGADLVVAGSPVMAFSLPTESMIATTAKDPKAPSPPDLSHPSLRSWLDALPASHACAASFETRVSWSPLGATGAIDSRFRKAGYRTIAKGHRFVVRGVYGPLKDGEIAKARAWGAELAHTMH